MNTSRVTAALQPVVSALRAQEQELATLRAHVASFDEIPRLLKA